MLGLDFGVDFQVTERGPAGCRASCGGDVSSAAGLEFGDDEAHATDDVVRWRLVQGEGQDLNGEGHRVWAQHKVAGIEFDEAKE